MPPKAVAFWLLPAEPARSELGALIERLCRAHAAVSFVPHVTLEVQSEASLAPKLSLQGALARAAQGVGRVRLRTIGIGHSAQLFKTLFIELECSSRLQQLQAALRGAFRAPQGQDYALRPHLSLLYKELPSGARRQLAAQLQPPAQLLCDRIAAVSPGPRGWSDIASWHELCHQSLGRGST